MLETVGDNISTLADAAANIPGLEWLAELDLEDYQSDLIFRDPANPDATFSHRLYALMTNQRAMNQLLSRWNAWVHNPTQHARRGFGPFKDLFIHLNDVRRWGPQDRIDQTMIVENWRDTLQHRPDQPARFEAELWFRRRPETRAMAFGQLTHLVQAQGGRSLAQAAIESIRYHGVLLEMPSQAVLQTLQQIDAGSFIDLLRCDGVMFFRPLGQARFPSPVGDTNRFDVPPRLQAALPEGNPRAALLDGLPVASHTYLDGRLLLDDPDEHGTRYEPQQQRHGTAMASLMIQGDLQENGDALKSPLYARPILIPFEQLGGTIEETTPTDVLIVDLLHRAITRIAKELVTTKESVRIVNLSIADAYKPFLRELSPLARLLDWLAWDHQLLILVSAGNQTQPICLGCSGDEFARMSDDDALKMVLKSIDDDQSARRHFSPAEAVNVVSVGALHADSSALRAGDRRVDLLRGQRLPSPIATVSYGFNRSIKPEILLPGGRVLFQSPLAQSSGRWEFKLSSSVHPPGQQVAAPGTRPLELDRAVYCSGSSNATALASRTAVRILERLDEVLADYPGITLDNGELVCLTKALLIHGASWGQAGETIERLLANPSDDWRRRLSIKAKFLGFGEVDPNRCLFCSDQRATLLGWGYLTKDSAHAYRFPLPPSLSAKRTQRRLTVTLAWLTPINPQHRDYRKAALWFSLNGETVGVERENLDQDSAKRGTVVHQVLQGDRGRALPDELEIKVNCKEHAAGLVERVPYGLAVTLEIAEGLAIPIYEEVRVRIRPRIPITPGRATGS